METYFPQLENHAQETMDEEKNRTFASFKIQQLLLGFSLEEIDQVRIVSGSYLLMLETIAEIKRQKGGHYHLFKAITIWGE